MPLIHSFIEVSDCSSDIHVWMQGMRNTCSWFEEETELKMTKYIQKNNNESVNTYLSMNC